MRPSLNPHAIGLLRVADLVSIGIFKCGYIAPLWKVLSFRAHAPEFHSLYAAMAWIAQNELMFPG